MVKISSSSQLFFVLLLHMLNEYFVQGRPQFIENIQTLRKVGQSLNNSSSVIIKKLTSNNPRDDGRSNKTKTRILFRGELVGDFGEQDIIFPDTYQVIFESIPRIQGPPKCAQGSTFCEDLDSYPYHQVRDILNRKQVNNDFFGEDEAPDEQFTISNRNTNAENFVCTSVQRTIFPKIGKNKNNKWKYIINQEQRDGYIQGIRIEVCRKEGSTCDLIGDVPNGYITSCKQKFMLRRLMSLSDSGDPVQDTFQIPSACCCSYRKDFSFLSRLGGAEDRSNPKSKERLL